LNWGFGVLGFWRRSLRLWQFDVRFEEIDAVEKLRGCKQRK
jgi:hypothetical protein